MRSFIRLSLGVVSSAALAVPVACSSGSEHDEAPETMALAVDGAAPIVSGIGGKCLDDSGGHTTNGNKIQLWDCNGTPAQQWSLSGGTIVGVGGKCLDIQDDHQVAGTVVDLYQCNSTNAQRWTVDGTSIKSTSGLCLDARGGVNADGTQVQIYDCNGTASQVWQVSAKGAPCTFNGETVESGEQVTPSPFASASVPFGETCTTAAVTCNDGVLSPSGASATCTVAAKTTGPSLRQYNTEQTNGGSGVGEVNSVVQFKKPTQAGNTLWVVATIPNDGGQKDVTVEDSQGNTFVALDFEQDNSKGAQSVWHFYATNIKGDSATPDTVTVHWGWDNYKGVLVAEVAGVAKASLVGHHGNIQDFNAPAGDNGVTSSDVDVGASDTPAILLSVSMDTFGGTSDEGGDGQAGPLAGKGFTAVDTMWNWDPGALCTGNIPCKLGTFETISVTNSGNVAGRFTARAPAGSGIPAPT